MYGKRIRDVFATMRYTNLHLLTYLLTYLLTLTKQKSEIHNVVIVHSDDRFVLNCCSSSKYLTTSWSSSPSAICQSQIPITFLVQSSYDTVDYQ